MRESINKFREALDAAPTNFDTETRGELVTLGLALADMVGEPYTYGVPGSDPNVEQLRDGCLRITLIDPIKSGTEVIEQLRMRVPTLGDNKLLKVEDSDNVGEVTQALIDKIKLVCVIDGTDRKMANSEIEKMSEEDGRTLSGALAFLRGRFRRTGKTYKTS